MVYLGIMRESFKDKHQFAMLGRVPITLPRTYPPESETVGCCFAFWCIERLSSAIGVREVSLVWPGSH